MKKNAFTLIESLIVLFIVGIVTLIGHHHYENIREQLVETSFIRQFETDFLETQKWAIIYDINTSIGYENETFLFYQGGQQIKDTMAVPAEITVRRAPDRLIFQRKSGRASRLAAFIFELQHQKEKITYQIQMGSGKYVKTVQKIN